MPPRAKTTATRTKKAATTAAASKNGIVGSAFPARDRLSSLPPEIFCLILDYIQDAASYNALCRLNTAYYAMAMPRVYSQLAVSASHHPKIAKLIRTLEPLLSISQRKQLKKEGKYKGQMEKYPKFASESEVPKPAALVREFISGWSDPGRKHQYIVERYTEEALRNTCNVRIFEAYAMIGPIASRVATFEHLQALNVVQPIRDPDEVESLQAIKNLRHLAFAYDGYSQSKEPWYSILVNSATTLRSLGITIHNQGTDMFYATLGQPKAQTLPSLPNLEELSLERPGSSNGEINTMFKAVNFRKLCRLRLGHLEHRHSTLLKVLAGMFASTPAKGEPLKLRELILDNQEGVLVEVAQFLGSFNTLQRLCLVNYCNLKQPDGIHRRPLDGLFSAARQHIDLAELRVQSSFYSSGESIVPLAGPDVAAITTQLVRLRHLELPIDHKPSFDVFEALGRARNLEYLKLEPITTDYQPWSCSVEDLKLHFRQLISTLLSLSPLRPITSSIPSTAAAHASPDKFTWENSYRLSHVSLSREKWHLASHFNKTTDKTKKALNKPELITASMSEFAVRARAHSSNDAPGDTANDQNHTAAAAATVTQDERQVYARDVTNQTPILIHVGYDKDSEWLRMVRRTTPVS